MNNPATYSDTATIPAFITQERACGVDSEDLLRHAHDVAGLAERYEVDARIFNEWHPVGKKAREKAPALRATEALFRQAAADVAEEERVRAEERAAADYQRRLRFSQTTVERGENVEIPV